MAHISVTHEPDTFVITVEGDLTYGEIIEIMRLHYADALPSDVLWDFTHGSLNTLTIDQARAIALEAKTLVQRRDGGRTAYAGSQDVVFSLTCLYSALAALADVPIEYSVFRTTTEARQWFAARREADEVDAAPLPNPISSLQPGIDEKRCPD